MQERFRRWLPTREQLNDNRWLRWLGPALQHPRLWHLNRRGLALGVAIGIFFGFMIPLAQIPASAALAVALRANVPAAAASTLVTNPVTFGPIYYAAWKVGSALLGEPDAEPPADVEPPPLPVEAHWLERTWSRIAGVGKPLALGLSLFAVGFAGLSYLLVSWAWALRVSRKRRRRGVAARERREEAPARQRG